MLHSTADESSSGSNLESSTGASHASNSTNVQPTVGDISEGRRNDRLAREERRRLRTAQNTSAAATNGSNDSGTTVNGTENAGTDQSSSTG
jgi:hypothetical protein